jgi:hypothetical protein
LSLLPQGSSPRVLPDFVHPIGAFDDNVYLSWLSNKTGNWETMLRTSNDSGKTFADKINLSNTTGSDSQDPNIAAYGDNVYVTWHDNKTGNWDTYIRTSKDRGQTFGDIIRINGTGTLPQKDRLEILLDWTYSRIRVKLPM